MSLSEGLGPPVTRSNSEETPSSPPRIAGSFDEQFFSIGPMPRGRLGFVRRWGALRLVLLLLLGPERIQWIASIMGVVIVALGIIAAVVTYYIMDTRKYDTESMRLQTCAIRKDISKIDSQLREMCEDE